MDHDEIAMMMHGDEWMMMMSLQCPPIFRNLFLNALCHGSVAQPSLQKKGYVPDLKPAGHNCRPYCRTYQVAPA